MSSVLGDVVLASSAFVGTMLDNYFDFAEQLSVTEAQRHTFVGSAQAIGVAGLFALSGVVAFALADIPLRLIGILALGPWLLALHAWRHRDDPARESRRRGVITTLLATFALGGDNLAVWIPLLRVEGWNGLASTLGIFALGEVALIKAASSLSRRPRIVAWGRRASRLLIPFVYLALGGLILLACHTL